MTAPTVAASTVAASTVAASNAIAPVSVAAAPAPVSVAAGPWQVGQAVRHPRYGVGAVVEISGDTVACEFGKLGARAFPLAMCPLTAIAGAAP